MTITELKELLEILKAFSVTEYQTADLKLVLSSYPHTFPATHVGSGRNLNPLVDGNTAEVDMIPETVKKRLNQNYLNPALFGHIK